MAKISLHIYTYYIFLIHSSIEIHLGCLLFLVIMSNAATNMEVQIYLRDIDFISILCIPRHGIARSYVSSIFNLLRNCQTISIMAVATAIYFPTNSV